ncbi:MAG: hypothetical protein Q9191_001319 [Dirinaria sp. TL-2023a]
MAGTETSKPPALGLLTRTLVDSPVLKLIIPARIRHASRNDVVFVRQNSIEIKEIRGHGSDSHHPSPEILDVAVKNDFDSPIRAARIFGLPRLFDPTIKQENTTEPGFGASLNPELPPQILALTLESMKLVFLCAFHDSRGNVMFQSNYRILSAAGETSQSQQLGEHIAVDPKSRAMAVAANEGSFYLYALKSMSDLKEEFNMADDSTLDPIIGASIHQVLQLNRG